MKISRGLILTLPAVATFLCLFITPLVHGFWLSLHETHYGIVQPGVTLKHYISLFDNPTYFEALVRTLKLSSSATLLTLAFGYPFAYALAFKVRRMAGILMIILIAPLLMNVVIRTLGWVLILGRNGLINQMLDALGIGQYTILYTEAAVLIGYVQVFMPFMVLSILASLQTMDLNLMKASNSLGCSPFKSFWMIMFPLSLPGIMSGSVIVFSLSSGVFVLPAILGGVRTQVLSFLAYRQTIATLNYPLGAATAFLLLTMVILLIVLSTYLVEKSRYKEVFRRATV